MKIKEKLKLDIENILNPNNQKIPASGETYKSSLQDIKYQSYFGKYRGT